MCVFVDIIYMQYTSNHHSRTGFATNEKRFKANESISIFIVVLRKHFSIYFK